MIEYPTLTIDTQLRIQSVIAAPQLPPLFRVKHDLERWGHARDIVLQKGMALPEVFPCFPNQYTILTRRWQLLWRALNPNATNLQWRKILSCHRAFTNDHGFDCGRQGHGPFADFVNGQDLSAELPRAECLLCGGAIVTGVETTYKGAPHLMLETLDGRAGATVPTLEWVLARPWLYFEAISVSPDGSTQSFSLTPYPEYVPLIANIFPVYFPMAGLVRLTEAEAMAIIAERHAKLRDLQ